MPPDNQPRRPQTKEEPAARLAVIDQIPTTGYRPERPKPLNRGLGLDHSEGGGTDFHLSYLTTLRAPLTRHNQNIASSGISLTP